MWFGGDVMQHLPQVEAARSGEGFDYGPVFAALAPRMRAADLAVVNLETTLTRRERYTGYPLFRSEAPGASHGIYRSAESVGAEGGEVGLASADLSGMGSALPEPLQRSMEASAQWPAVSP